MRVVLAAALPLVAHPASPEHGPVGDVQWLAGCWERAHTTGRTVEHWTAPADGMMLGTSWSVTAWTPGFGIHADSGSESRTACPSTPPRTGSWSSPTGDRSADSDPSPVSLHVVLIHPQIHWNTGNAGRTCLAAGATLHIIEPLGFSLDEREVKRAGLDYWDKVDLRVWDRWEDFERQLPAIGEPFFFSMKATRVLWDAPLGEPDDAVLIFGRETTGLPGDLHDRYPDRFVGMPILSPFVRSLNLSTSVGIAVYEVLRQRRARATSRRDAER